MPEPRHSRPVRPELVWRWPVARRRARMLAHPRLLFAAVVLAGLVVLLIVATSARAL